MRRILLGLLAMGATSSVALAADDTATITAELVVEAECEVVVTDIVATTDNFVGTDVTLQHSGSITDTFDNAPDGTTIDGASTVAVLCSAGSVDHNLNLLSNGANLVDGSENIPWSPFYAPLNTPSATNAIATTPGTDVPLTANATDASLHQYIVTANVAADDIAAAVPGTYSQTIGVTVSYTAP